jgi:isopentenyl diphosphate isomerase/L-lactate dehydrogenase-like FMN-dependent dehydrogenase
MDVSRAISVEDLRTMARARLPRAVFDFIDGAATDERTLRANLADFDRVCLVPRFLRGLRATRLDTTMLGAPAGAPLIIAPTGLATMTRHDADLHLATEAAAAGIPFVLSTSSGNTIEEVASVGPGRRWFQVYVFKDRSITEGLIERAAAAGYETLVLTVDVPVVGKRERDWRSGFTIPLRLTPRSMIDFAMHPAWCLELARHGVPTMRNFDGTRRPGDAMSHAALMNSQLDQSLDWGVLDWLRARWRGPILVKGLLSLDDALTAADRGADGIVISNHGGRQLDGVSSSIRAMADWGGIASERMPVFVDSGFRRGGDIVKALALGATAVLIGRPTLYGAAAGGAEGVRRCLRILFDEMHVTLAHLGAGSIAEVDRRCVVLDGERV